MVLADYQNREKKKQVMIYSLFKGLVQCSQWTTVIYMYPDGQMDTFALIHSSLLLLSARLSSKRLAVIFCGLRGQIAIYSLPVGEVCVQVVNIPPLSPCVSPLTPLFLLLLLLLELRRCPRGQ